MNTSSSGISSLHFDYIIAGAGCAGLSLLIRMIESGKFSNKKILLVDKEPKIKNDRTWCFWENGNGFFESQVYKCWKHLSFYGGNNSKTFDIAPYQYKMIRGIDFYEYGFSVIKDQPNITVQYGTIESMKSTESECYIIMDGLRITSEYIFNSILFSHPTKRKNKHYLLQHFKGWVIKTDQPVFKENTATLMDFRVAQQNGTSFVYVMPFAANKALIEYTLFTEKQLAPEEYDRQLDNYLKEFLQIADFTIEEMESGVIPMTNHKFTEREGNIIHIGTAGGQTKASSGYTFQFIQKKTAAIVESLIETGKPFTKKGCTPARFHFYDSVLLHILEKNKLGGDLIFSRMFFKNDPLTIFKFLDNESSLKQDWAIISSLPVIPFAKAAIKEVFV